MKKNYFKSALFRGAFMFAGIIFALFFALFVYIFLQKYKEETGMDILNFWFFATIFNILISLLVTNVFYMGPTKRGIMNWYGKDLKELKESGIHGPVKEVLMENTTSLDQESFNNFCDSSFIFPFFRGR